jgi:hypothetical protein
MELQPECDPSPGPDRPDRVSWEVRRTKVVIRFEIQASPHRFPKNRVCAAGHVVVVESGPREKIRELPIETRDLKIHTIPYQSALFRGISQSCFNHASCDAARLITNVFGGPAVRTFRLRGRGVNLQRFGFRKESRQDCERQWDM